MEDFGKVYLFSPEDVVRCSFMVQKSLTPLDLNTLEFCYRTLTPFTEEGFQKLYGVEERRVLFEYNLDVSRGLEEALKEHDPVDKFGNNKFETSVYRGVKLPDNYYYNYIHHSIMEAIEKSCDKMATLKKFLPLIKMMQVSSISLDDEAFHFFARILQEECTDSVLVAEVVEILGKQHFSHFLLGNYGEMEHMEYFLYHMQNRKIQMQFETGNYYPVSRSLLVGKFQRAIALIKYGKLRQPLNDDDISHCISTFCAWSDTAKKWIKWNRRYYYEDEELELWADDLSRFKKMLFLLLVSVFGYQVEYNRPRSYLHVSPRSESPDVGIQALRLMSRSFPEPYLTLSEVRSVWGPDGDGDRPTADQVYTLYRSEIMDCRNQDLDVEGPRTLQHLARCEIRRRLVANCALPDGIQLLGLPQPVQEFLSLER